MHLAPCSHQRQGIVVASVFGYHGSMVPSDEFTDDPCLQKAIAGDEAAMAELFGQYRERLRRMIALRMDRRMQGRVDASDVLQDAYVDLAQQLADYGLENVLIVSTEVGENLYLAARNLHQVDVRDVEGVDPVSLIAYDKVMVTVDAVKKLEEMLG
jgi:hypothetical protein